jgi:FAD/FMN-containing dehydrogenase
MSKLGATCDSLLSADLVTADGEVLRASEDEHPDLFWAIRGGGGNFGIATALEYRLHPVGEVLAGKLAFGPGRVESTLAAFAAFVATAPDEMNVVGIVQRGEVDARFTMLVCHCGDPFVGNRLLAPLRALGPREDELRVAPYLEINASINPAAPVAHFQSNVFLPELDATAIATIAAAAKDAPPNARVFIVPFYGAITRVPVGDTAFALRSVGYELDLMGRWDGREKDEARATAWVAALRDALRPRATGVYVNQLGETSEPLVREAYAANYARLATLKRKYDPDNVLQSNQNIRPA